MKAQHGTVMVEVTLGCFLALMLTSAVFLLVLHLWTRAYVQTEAFFLARARMYQNTDVCAASERLVPGTWVRRRLRCAGASVEVRYELLPTLFATSDLVRVDLHH